MCSVVLLHWILLQQLSKEILSERVCVEFREGATDVQQTRKGQRGRLYMVRREKLCLLDSNNELLFICSHWQLTLCVERSSTCVQLGAFVQEGWAGTLPTQCRMWRESTWRWLTAADASNPDKAKESVNSVSSILVYICPPMPASSPFPPSPTMTGPCDEGTA